MKPEPQNEDADLTEEPADPNASRIKGYASETDAFQHLEGQCDEDANEDQIRRYG